MKILVIEDEDSLRDVMIRSLEKERYVVEWAANYREALWKMNDYSYDCIVLDIMLPDGSGLSLLEELKKMKKKDSVIIVSAKDSIDDKVRGLDLGADDYLTKPFHLAELNARIKSIIRRKQQDGEMNLSYANIIIYPDRHAVFIDGEELLLNRKEFDLLYYFVTNPERLLSKDALAESVWGDYIDQVDSFDFIYSQVKNLRKKLKTSGAKPEIKAVYGFGYKMTYEE
ncbi:DNA-binding response OmpR family regulator [Parabacteroides sp. PFB2-12]|uniref:response regulator transcription factor n=1 Tax=unclassified Parabacteroides TaxID=2649774 RepID=UPI0024735709|nr:MULTISPECIES: response regulator transcription factor [unclassified Parabacteroides]MDH6342700.1 DNA-binding response OmpR family regulator [Parabacteroides sp. PM6-13]MDH6389763.1 DNA-binding response OmpR family regulator [Parabacteroides sp. PFB2-12]